MTSKKEMLKESVGMTIEIGHRNHTNEFVKETITILDYWEDEYRGDCIFYGIYENGEYFEETQVVKNITKVLGG